jgi:hypothetical protein
MVDVTGRIRCRRDAGALKMRLSIYGEPLSKLQGGRQVDHTSTSMSGPNPSPVTNWFQLSGRSAPPVACLWPLP